jgi:hypothetical protein
MPPLKKRPERVEGSLSTASGIELRDFADHGLNFEANKARTKCWYIRIDTGNQSLRDVFLKTANHVLKTYRESYLLDDDMLICKEDFPCQHEVLNKMRQGFQKAKVKLVLIGDGDKFIFKFQKA